VTQLQIWANANAPEHAAERARLDEAGGEVTAFAAFVDDSEPVSNVHAAKLKTIDEIGRWPSAFGFELAAANQDRTIAEGNYESKQGAWFGRREAVEQTMGVTRSAVYASLSCKGPGIPTYGEFCLILEPTSAIQGVLPFNSAEHYADDNAVIDTDALEREAASWDYRATAATLRHEPELRRDAIGIDWITRRETLLASADDPSNFVEVVIVDPDLSLDSCAVVRIASDQYETLNKLDALNDRGGPLTLEERARLVAFHLLLDRERAGTMSIERR
jgi:hypothetical protein